MSALEPDKARVRAALEAAAISPARCGPERMRRLSDDERGLYLWILASFARADPPRVDELCDQTSELGLEIEETLERFAGLDLVHHDPASGEILVAYRSRLARAATRC